MSFYLNKKVKQQELGHSCFGVFGTLIQFGETRSKYPKS